MPWAMIGASLRDEEPRTSSKPADGIDLSNKSSKRMPWRVTGYLEGPHFWIAAEFETGDRRIRKGQNQSYAEAKQSLCNRQTR